MSYEKILFKKVLICHKISINWINLRKALLQMHSEQWAHNKNAAHI